jgi:effector-binding domain-containing protein
MQYLEELGESHTGNAFAAYHNMDMQNMDVEAGFPVSRALPGRGDIQPGKIPGGWFAVCHYTGPYDQLGPAYEFLTQYSADRGYHPGSVAYEWYLTGPDVPPQEMKTDIVFPVTPVALKTMA